jgi:hypothetical protein
MTNSTVRQAKKALGSRFIASIKTKAAKKEKVATEAPVAQEAVAQEANPVEVYKEKEVTQDEVYNADGTLTDDMKAKLRVVGGIVKGGVFDRKGKLTPDMQARVRILMDGPASKTEQAVRATEKGVAAGPGIYPDGTLSDELSARFESLRYEPGTAPPIVQLTGFNPDGTLTDDIWAQLRLLMNEPALVKPEAPPEPVLPDETLVEAIVAAMKLYMTKEGREEMKLEKKRQAEWESDPAYPYDKNGKLTEEGGACLDEGGA